MPLETELLALSRDCTPYGYYESYAGASNPLARLLLLPAFLWFETSLFRNVIPATRFDKSARLQYFRDHANSEIAGASSRKHRSKGEQLAVDSRAALELSTTLTQATSGEANLRRLSVMARDSQ